MLRNAGSLAAALLLAGCISLAPKPPKALIRLTPVASAPAGELGAGSTEPPLVVFDFETNRELDVMRVPVKTSASAVAYIKGATWIEKPSRQMRSLVAETIRAKDNRLVFEGVGADTAGRPVLSGRLSAMGYDAVTGSVVVQLDAQLTTPGGAPKVHRFEAQVPGIAPDAAAVGPALDRAANEVAAEVASWVG